MIVYAVGTANHRNEIIIIGKWGRALYSPVKVEAKNYLDEDEAIEFAQKASMYNINEGELEVEFKEKWQEPDKEETRPVWVVGVTYPAGNKTIFYIDAISGDPLSVAEIEPDMESRRIADCSTVTIPSNTEGKYKCR